MTAATLVPIEGGRAQDVTATPPPGLPDEQHEVWRAYAGLAIAANTLTKQTEPAFRLLCELAVEMRKTKETLDEHGRTYIQVVVDGAGQEHNTLKAHPLTTSYRQLAQRVEALLARFGLAPFGKPIAAPKKPTAAGGAWASIAAAKNGRP